MPKDEPTRRRASARDVDWRVMEVVELLRPGLDRLDPRDVKRLERLLVQISRPDGRGARHKTLMVELKGAFGPPTAPRAGEAAVDLRRCCTGIKDWHGISAGANADDLKIMLIPGGLVLLSAVLAGRDDVWTLASSAPLIIGIAIFGVAAWFVRRSRKESALVDAGMKALIEEIDSLTGG